MGDPSGKNPSESKLSTGQERELSSDEAEAFARQFKAIWDKSAKPERSVAKSAPGNGGQARAAGSASAPTQAFIPRPQDITPRGLGPVSSLPPPPVSSAPPAAKKTTVSNSLPSPQASAALAAPAPQAQPAEAQPPQAPIPNLAALGITAPSRNATSSDNGKPTNPGTHPAFKQTLLGLTPVVLPVAPVDSVTSAPPVQVEAASAPALAPTREVQKSEPAVLPKPFLAAEASVQPFPSPFVAATSALPTGLTALDDETYPVARKVPKLAFAIGGVVVLAVLAFLLFGRTDTPPEADSKQPAKAGDVIGAKTPVNPVPTTSAPATPPTTEPTPPERTVHKATGNEGRPEPKPTPPKADTARPPRAKDVKERKPPVAKSIKRPVETKAAPTKATPPPKSPAIVRDNPF